MVLMGSSGPVGVMTNQKITLAGWTIMIALRFEVVDHVKIGKDTKGLTA